MKLFFYKTKVIIRIILLVQTTHSSAVRESIVLKNLFNTLKIKISDKNPVFVCSAVSYFGHYNYYHSISITM